MEPIYIYNSNQLLQVVRIEIYFIIFKFVSMISKTFNHLIFQMYHTFYTHVSLLSSDFSKKKSVHNQNTIFNFKTLYSNSISCMCAKIAYNLIRFSLNYKLRLKTYNYPSSFIFVQKFKILSIDSYCV